MTPVSLPRGEPLKLVERMSRWPVHVCSVCDESFSCPSNDDGTAILSACYKCLARGRATLATALQMPF